MRRVSLTVLAALAGLLVLLVVEAVLARRGPVEDFVNPSRAPRSYGAGGAPLAYVVLGDSTGAGQGAVYDAGIAVGTARHLARTRRVTLVNGSVSGARMADVLRDQVAAAAALRPDVVLLAAGANDVIALTLRASVQRDLEHVVARLRAANPAVRIVLTAAPDMGAIPRFAQPLRTLAGWRTGQVNARIRAVARREHLVLAPIAERTGPAFRADPSLFAADRFHPDARGYASWTPVLNDALDRALAASG